jgi:hypothetical protein
MDYTNPDYTAIFAERAKRLTLLMDSPELLQAARIHYKNHPADFINDWGMTFDPRQLEKGLLANIPFILWPRQREYIEWLYERWQAGERGIVEKSRDCGVTWLSVGFAVASWCFHDGVAIGFGSRKESLVDKLGDPDSIFEKIRHFVRHVPQIFLPPMYNEEKNATFMRLINPAGSSITGEAGDNIGRGGRKSIVFVDEAAFVEHQEMVDKALSQTTNCQIDISTFNGSGNAFYEKTERFKGTPRHFVFDWRDDPRKDDAWYQRQKAEQTEETVAQEIDRDPLASNVDSFIPAKWVKASIDAHIKLGFGPEGIKSAGFDPADTGDAKGLVIRHGSVITEADQMTEGDITQALPWAFSTADQARCQVFAFDADGMGAPVIKTYLMTASANAFQIAEYRGSGAVKDKKKRYGGKDGIARTNADTFVNYRAQTWAAVRRRFELTYHAVQKQQEGMLINVDPDELISISSNCANYNQLVSELPQPKRLWRNGKIGVENKKDMTRSPNLADALVVAMSVEKIHEDTRTNVFDRYVPHRVGDAGAGY